QNDEEWNAMMPVSKGTIYLCSQKPRTSRSDQHNKLQLGSWEAHAESESHWLPLDDPAARATAIDAGLAIRPSGLGNLSATAPCSRADGVSTDQADSLARRSSR